MNEQQVNDFVTNLYKRIANKEFKLVRLQLINLLREILNSFELRPIDRPIEYELVEYLLFKFNNAPIVELNNPIDQKFPLNSYLLQCFEEPAEINAILFHIFEYLHPEGYESYNKEILIESLNKLEIGEHSLLPKHEFIFEGGTMKIIQNNRTHIVSI